MADLVGGLDHGRGRFTEASLKAPLLDGSILEEQLRLEREAIDAGVREYRRLAAEAVKRGEGASLKPAERLQAHWFETLTVYIRDEQRACRRGDQGRGRAIHGPPIRLVPAEKLAAIVMHTAIGECMRNPGGVKAFSLTYAIGRAVLAELNLRAMRNKARPALRELERRFRRLSPQRVNWWAKKSLDDPWAEKQAAAYIGAALLDILINHAAAGDYLEDVFMPAFERKDRRQGRRTIAYIRFTRAAERLIGDGHAMRATLRPKYLPMVVPPYPWSHEEAGGYVEIKTPLIAKPTPGQKRALAASDLGEMYDCLTIVSGTPFRENRRIAAAVEQEWRDGGGELGIPLRRNPPRPTRPPGYDPDAPRGERWSRVDPEVKLAYKREAAKARKFEIKLKGERREFLEKLHVAETMRRYPRFYYPGRIDFRGRWYPVPQPLHIQGDDLCRGMLEFAEGKDPGDEGRYWLWVQVAEFAGQDKLPYAQRYEWARDHERQILRAAADPHTDTWWRDPRPLTERKGRFKKPWQLLAACIAVADPEAGAHAAVGRDGTCNGLQHYAALGRDAAGAARVNMLPADAPHDLYSDVAAEVKAAVQADAMNDGGRVLTFKTEDGEESVRVGALASNVLAYIGRDLAKAPTMTFTYGVTTTGIRRQLAAKLKEAGAPNESRYRCAIYLADVVLAALATTSSGATATMGWLRLLAELVVAKNRPVGWTMPLGLQVEQPYRNYREARVRTVLQQFTVRAYDETLPVAVKKQCDGFAPNFVHSIDAAHMYRSARACFHEGITFAAVHDCYRTHAATIAPMDRIIREQFVVTHTRPLLQELVAELRARHPDIEFPDPPPAGTYDPRSVLVAPYFFS